MKPGPYFSLFQALAAELKKRPDQGLVFWWDDFEKVSCVQCGMACDRPWKVHISKEYLDTWGAKFSELMQKPLTDLIELDQVETSNRYATLQKQADGKACVMLNERRLCRIHEAWGPEAKPDICQKYPLTIVKLEKGNYYAKGLAGSCTSVAQNLSQTRTLKYQWVQLEKETPQPLLPIFNQKHLDFGAYLSWIGFQLDSLRQSKNLAQWLNWQTGFLLKNSGQPLQTAKGMADALSEFEPTETLPVLAFGQQAQILNWLQDNILARRSTMNPLAEWIASKIQTALLPGLDSEEVLLMENYLKAWLQQQIILQAHLIQGSLNLLQQLLSWGLNLLLLQLWAIYEREQHGGALQASDLHKALNQIYAYIIQDYSPAGIQRYQHTRTEGCLVQLGLLARWSWDVKL
jgi:Fe-S-cluster containining protein